MKRIISLLLVFSFVFSFMVTPEAAACWYKGSAQGYGNPAISGKPQEQKGDNDGRRNESSFAEPVFLHNGDFVYTKQDLFIPSRGMPIEITRTYKSQSLYNSRFGYGWDINYNQRLVPLSNGNVLWLDGKDKRNQFSYLDGTNFISPAHLYEILKLNSDGTWTITQKDKTQLIFNQNGCLIKIIDRNNNQITFSYSSAKLPLIGVSPYALSSTPQVISYDWQLLKITDTVGREINLSYDTNGRLKTITDFAGRVITYDYSAEGDLLSLTYPATVDFPSGTIIRYSYTQHNLETITDAKGQVYLENFYNAQDMVDSQKTGSGTVYFSYNTENKKTEVRDAKGFKTIYTFNDNGNPIKKEEFTAGLRVGEPASYVTTYEYNQHMELTKIIYPKGNSIEYTYDGLGNLLEIRRKPPASSTVADIVTAFTYEPRFNKIKTIKEPKGYITTYTYDYENVAYGTSAGNLMKITYPSVSGQVIETKFTYNSFGQVETVTDSNGNITKYEYAPATGYLTKMTNGAGALNITTEMTYDAVGNVVTFKDPKGNISNFGYDSHNNLIKTISAAPFNYITTHKYDANDNLIQVDRETRSTSNPWQTTYYTYDILDRLETIKDELGNTTTFTYDLNGNRSSIRDAQSNTTYYEYDERNLLWKVKDALSNATEYAYDNNANLKQIKDAKGNKTTYAYDTFDRLYKTTYPDASFEAYGYDANSNVTYSYNPKKQYIYYTYDALNRLNKKKYPDASTITYTYDKSSRLTDVVDSTGTIHYDYDVINRITKVSYPGAKAVSYQYDPNSNRTKLIYPDSSFITYSYDQLNRLVYINNQASQVIVHYYYDVLSRRIRLDLLNGTQTVYGYDAANRLTDLTNRLTATPTTIISKSSYTYDNAGNRKTMTTSQGAHTYTYDAIYQLKTATYPSGFTFSNPGFTYDSVGNRTQLITGTATTSYTVNILNQYTQAGTSSFAYDANGSLTSDGTFSYTYDYENRLISASKTGTTASYKYDPFGRRIEKKVNSTTTNFLYDGDQIIAEYDGAGALLKKFIYGAGIDEVLKGLSPKGTVPEWYYHYDGLGSVTNLTNSAGATIETYSYDAFGKTSIKNASGTAISTSALGNRFMFTGREYDAETGLYYYRARYYSPTMGRFLQRDPVGYSAGINLYGYCKNNSINFVDPLGLYTLIIHGRGHHESGYSGGIGNALEAAGETVKEVIWSGNPAEKNVTLKIQNEIKQAAEIAKARGESLNIIGHSWGGVLASFALRETKIRVDNFVTMGIPYFNFTRPGGVVRYANIITEGDIFGFLSIFNLTAKQIGVTSNLKNLRDIHNSYWNDPEIISVILKMFGLDKGKKK